MEVYKILLDRIRREALQKEKNMHELHLEINASCQLLSNVIPTHGGSEVEQALTDLVGDLGERWKEACKMTPANFFFLDNDPDDPLAMLIEIARSLSALDGKRRVYVPEEEDLQVLYIRIFSSRWKKFVGRDRAAIAAFSYPVRESYFLKSIKIMLDIALELFPRPDPHHKVGVYLAIYGAELNRKMGRLLTADNPLLRTADALTGYHREGNI